MGPLMPRPLFISYGSFVRIISLTELVDRIILAYRIQSE